MVCFSIDLKYRVCQSCNFDSRAIILAAMLKRISLHNFMSHSDTVIDLSAGLTVLTGPNNCGKSAFVTALQVLSENAIGDFMVRHGAKECRVTVETDDGHTIEWKRKKKVVSYNIDGEDFHRLRNDVPDKLRQVLKLSKVKAGDNDEFDVHFGEQKSPIFLLNDRGSRAARFFASSSDASVLIEMQKRHRSKVKAAQQEFQRQQNEFKQTSAVLEVLAPVPGLKSKLEELDQTYDKLQSENQQIQQLETLIQDWHRLSLEVLNLEKTVVVLNELPEELLQENEKPLELLTHRFDEVKQQVNQTRFQVAAMSALEEPPGQEDVERLNSLINDIQIQTRITDRASFIEVCLEKLVSPPELDDTILLQRLIDQIQAAEERVSIDRTAALILENCSPPPQMADLQKLQQMCNALEEAETQHSTQQQTFKTCESEYETVRAELMNWVQENPSCPTCGAELEPDQFIQSAEMGLKGHIHET